MSFYSLNESNKLNQFFYFAKDLFCIAGFDGYFKNINPAVSETLGYSESELFSKPINSFVHPDDQSITELHRSELRSAKPLNNFENRYIRKDGEEVWLSWTSVAIPEQQLIFAVAKNITTRKLKELELERNEESINAQQQELKELVYTALHDLRSPVANMLSIFDIFEELKSPEGPYEESLSLLRSSITDLKLKMDTYLDRLVKKDDPATGNTSLLLDDAVARVQATFSALISETDTIIKTDFSRSDTVNFDKTYFDSILLNLISNSIKYARPGVSPVIQLFTDETLDHVELFVTDNGLGFDHAEVGDRLFQLNQRFRPEIEGKGVGLFLVKKHLLNNGGNIMVNSVPGRGTTFKLMFKK